MGQKGLDRCFIDSKIPKMPAQTTYSTKLSVTIDGENKRVHNTKFKQLSVYKFSPTGSTRKKITT